MNPILRIIIISVNLILSYFLAREVVENLTLSQYILVTLIVVFTLIFSIFTTGTVRIERRLEIKENQQEELDEQE